ncbi:50S ribosomal protein L17 [Candidatus Wolfebacteria bacterium]|nr:50S ribosomal protein L17 [Candidatus Wolfebacteria bacterium]
MKKQTKAGRTFGRVRKVRTGLMRSLARGLILEESIETTEAKARSLRPYVEKLVTRAKVDSVANRRLVAARLGNDTETMNKLFTDLGPKYKDRAGGYTRIVKSPRVLEDGRKVAYISFV